MDRDLRRARERDDRYRFKLGITHTSSTTPTRSPLPRSSVASIDRSRLPRPRRRINISNPRNPPLLLHSLPATPYVPPLRAPVLSSRRRDEVCRIRYRCRSKEETRREALDRWLGARVEQYRDQDRRRRADGQHFSEERQRERRMSEAIWRNEGIRIDSRRPSRCRGRILDPTSTIRIDVNPSSE